MTVALIVLAVIVVWLFSAASCVRLVNIHSTEPEYLKGLDAEQAGFVGLFLGPFWLIIVALWAVWKVNRRPEGHPLVKKVHAYMFPEKDQ